MEMEDQPFKQDHHEVPLYRDMTSPCSLQLIEGPEYPRTMQQIPANPITSHCSLEYISEYLSNTSKPSFNLQSNIMSYHASETLNACFPVDVFISVNHNCYTETPNNANKRTGATDRFVPNRRQISRVHFAQQSVIDLNENSESNRREEEQSLKVSDIYKRHILGIREDNPNKQSMGTYRNINHLKFSQSHIEDDVTSFKSLMNIKDQLEVPVADRKINKNAIKVLDAPALQDDFYLNLIDWSEQNILAVGLNSSVYLWNAFTSRVSKLLDLNSNDDIVTAINWSPKYNTLAVGTTAGEVQIWDAVKNIPTTILQGHSARVGAISWNSPYFLSSGSRDKSIINWDVRVGSKLVSKYNSHKQEVCGLKWSFDQQQLASGGNDNKLCVWNTHSNQPVHSLTQHNAAVKAIAWSPHQHSLLASGGGTADKTIKFWNTLSGDMLNSIEAGSQVCNMMFSKTVNELVSTHGYSLNEINIWRYPKMTKVATLTGHTYRVLYLGMNPDGSTIVTGAGDETLRFWNIFPMKEKPIKDTKSQLSAQLLCLR